MYIVMIAAECAPVAKVGGLGDAVYGLSAELESRGHVVEIILPKYDCMRYDQINSLQPACADLQVPWCDGVIHCTVWFGVAARRQCFFIEPHSWDNFFDRGAFYGFWDEAMRFAFFTKAALEFMLKSEKRPDIIHTHDWHTALAPVLLFEIYEHHGMDRQRVCHTIHNFRHQGVGGGDVLWATGLHRPEYYCSSDKLGTGMSAADINYTKGAIAYSNFVTTVSPNHAWEARHTEQGFGLGHHLHLYQDKFGGVLNGLDYETWNPERDPHIAVRYTRDCIEKKRKATQALRKRFALRRDKKPLVAYVGHLDAQKGTHLVRHALSYSIENGAQFVLLCTGSEDGVEAEFEHSKQTLNDNPDCRIEVGFGEELTHEVYAGADIVLAPSIYEPCGSTQMIGLRYGAVPVVRSVGGFKDTVFDWDYAEVARDARNGFVFNDADCPGVESALQRAIKLWHERPAEFRELSRNGMACDYSWREPGRHYLNIYEHIRCP